MAKKIFADEFRVQEPEKNILPGDVTTNNNTSLSLGVVYNGIKPRSRIKAPILPGSEGRNLHHTQHVRGSN